MWRHLPAISLSAAIISACLVPRADGCAAVMPKGERVAIASESALIVWDEKTRTQHFIRRANFDTAAPYFGFLVPTPSMPTISEVPDGTFRMLEEWTKAEVKTEVKYRYRSLFTFPSDSKIAIGAAEKGPAMRNGPLPRPDVEVLNRVQVAGGEAVSLVGREGKKIREWLQKHGYEARPAIDDWLDWYAKNDWVITAFQFKRGAEAAGGMSPRAVRMSFKAERPFYPYREPADTRPREHVGPPRLLKVFFVGVGRHDGTLGKDGKWPARVEYSRPLTAERAASLAKGINGAGKDAGLNAAPAEVPEGAWLTEFGDPSTPRQGADEVYFSKSAGSELVRPPVINYTYVDAIYPAELAGAWIFAALVLLGGGWIVWRFGFRRGE